MYFVYFLRSESDPDKTYIDMTDNSETSAKGMGRLVFLACIFSLNLICSITFRFLLDTTDPLMGLYPLAILYSAFLSIIIEKRSINIGLFPTWPDTHIAMTAFLILAPLNFWISSSAANADPMGTMMSGVASILVYGPLNLFLLLMPSKQSSGTYKDRRNFNRIRKNLVKEKRELLMKQEIENLRAEISTLKKDQV